MHGVSYVRNSAEVEQGLAEELAEERAQSWYCGHVTGKLLDRVHLCYGLPAPLHLTETTCCNMLNACSAICTCRLFMRIYILPDIGYPTTETVVTRVGRMHRKA